MAFSDAVLEQRARRAYELGRWRAAAAAAWPAAPLAILSTAACSLGASPLAGGAALAAVLTVLRWRGGVWAQGVTPGLWAGALAFTPALLGRTLAVCPAGTLSPCAALCLAGGLAAGVAVALLARHREPQFLVATALVAGLTGGLGCAATGLLAIAAMAVGMAAGSSPILLAALPARR